MKLTTRSYHNDFIEIKADEIEVRIISKKEAIELLENLQEVIFDLNDFIKK